MPPRLALLAGFILVGYAFKLERERRAPVSKDLLWPFLWYGVAASRPVGVWLSLWGVSLPAGGGDASDGVFVDRYFYFTLTCIGLWVLSKRGFDWKVFFQTNPWLGWLCVFICLSFLWSKYPFVSFKRFIKLFGTIVMALIILTEVEPVEAMLTLVRRCALFHLPLSIICIRYFRDMSIEWDPWTGKALSWIGISTSKNVLGQVVMTCALCLIWERLRHWRTESWRTHRWVALDFVYIAMALYLLKGSDQSISMTSVSVFALGLLVFVRLDSLRAQMDKARAFSLQILCVILGIMMLVIVHSNVHFNENSFFGTIITKLGRDITLSGRTEIWSDVYDIAAQNPMLGVGYGAFWIGREANIPWSDAKSWVLGQAHSGYVDAYLQLGWVGLALLAGLVVSCFLRILRRLEVDYEFARIQMTFLLVILFTNITETSFLRGDHNMWLLFMLTALAVPVADRIKKARVESLDNTPVDSAQART